MSTYFFHLRSTAATTRDEIGTEFTDLDAAYLDTCETIIGMAADMTNAGCNSTPYVFDITDAAGTLLMEVPFTEMLNKGEKPQRPAAATPRKQVPPEVLRAQRLADEIAERMTALQNTIRQSRILVARSRTARRWSLHQTDCQPIESRLPHS